MNPILKKITIAAVLVSTSMSSTAFADTPVVMPVMAPASGVEVTTTVMDLSLPAAFILNDHKVSFDKNAMPFTAANDELYVPLKAFSTHLGYEVSWDAKERSVTLTAEGQSQKLMLKKDAERLYGFTLSDMDGRGYAARIINGSLYVTPSVYNESLGAVMAYDHLNQLRADRVKHAPEEASTLGEVISVVNGKDGIQILVKGQRYGKFGLDEVSLAVSRNVSVKLSNGNELSLSDIKQGDMVYVKYGMALTKSIPAMGQAESVTVLRSENLFEGKVYWKQTSSEGIAATMRQLRVVGTNDFVITVNDKTVISDAKGNLKTFDDLQEGMILKVVTAPFAALSYPAQTGAYRIEIIK